MGKGKKTGKHFYLLPKEGLSFGKITHLKVAITGTEWKLVPTGFIIAKTSGEDTGMFLSLEHVRYFIFSNLNRGTTVHSVSVICVSKRKKNPKPKNYFLKKCEFRTCIPSFFPPPLTPHKF